MMNREAIIISKGAVMTRFTNAELSINDFFVIKDPQRPLAAAWRAPLSR